MFRFLIVWVVAILATFIQTYYQRIPEIMPPQTAEVFVNNHLYKVDLIRCYDGGGDALIKLNIKNRAVSARIYFRGYHTHDEWVYFDMNRDKDFLIGAIPHQEPSTKIEYYLEFAENSEIVSVERNNPTVLSFEGRIPRLVVFVYFSILFFSMLMSNLTGLSVTTDRLNYRYYSNFTAFSLLLLAFVFDPIIQFYSSASKSLTLLSFAHFVSIKFMLWGFIWLFVIIIDRKKNKPTWVAATAFVLFALDIIPSLFFKWI